MEYHLVTYIYHEIGAQANHYMYNLCTVKIRLEPHNTRINKLKQHFIS